MKINKHMKMIKFTKKQFLALMKVVYLGNWMANAHRTKDIDRDYEAVEDYIFSLAPQFGFGKYLEHEKSDKDRYYPTSYFEDETDVHKFHEAYDEATFWDELAERLGEREFFEKYSKEEISKMTRDEKFIKFYECRDAINEELEKNGLKRFRISCYDTIKKNRFN